MRDWTDEDDARWLHDCRAGIAQQQDIIRLERARLDRAATPRDQWTPWQRACHRASVMPMTPDNDELAAILLRAGVHSKGYAT